MTARAPLEVEFLAPIVRDELLPSPPLPSGETELRLSIDQVHREAGLVRFRLHVAYGLAADYAGSFQDVEAGLVVVLREATTGRGTAFRFYDPNLNRLAEPWPNFHDRRTGQPTSVFTSARASVRLEARSPEAQTAPLLVHLALHGLTSPVVTIGTESAS